MYITIEITASHDGMYNSMNVPIKLVIDEAMLVTVGDMELGEMVQAGFRKSASLLEDNQIEVVAKAKAAQEASLVEANTEDVVAEADRLESPING